MINKKSMLRHKSFTKRQESNEEIRIRFEKEAHDREREDIDIVVDIHSRWVNHNSIKQLML